MSEHQPLVSLLVPVYNRADLLAECLDSALAQTVSDIEIVVVDGASTDGTWDVCLRYAESDARVRIYRDAENTGPVEGWWRCLELARGTLGTFLWSDDLLMPEFLATTAPMLSDARIAFAFTAAEIGPRPGSGVVHYAHAGPQMPSETFIEGSLLGTANLPVSPACALFRVADLRQSFIKELPTQPPFDLRATGAGTDVLLFLMTATRYPLVGCVGKPLAFFRAHAGSLTVEGRGGLVARSYGASKVWFARSIAKRGLSARILARHWLAEMKSTRRPISPATAARRAGNVVRPAALILAAAQVVAGLTVDRVGRSFRGAPFPGKPPARHGHRPMIQPPPDLLSTAPELVAGQRDWRRSLRLRPFDTSTPEGRAGERNRLIAWSIAISILARGVLIAVWFITIPLMVGYLGAERYGMWLTLSSLVAILGPLDLGIGNGLRQLVAEATGRDDVGVARRGISTAAVVLSGVALVVLFVAPVLGIVVPWAAIYNVSTPLAVEEAAPTTVVLLILFAVGLPLSIVGVVQAARQSAYLTSGWSIVGGLGSIAVLLLVIAGHGGLPVLVLAMTGATLLAALVNSGVYFGRQARSIAPRLRDYSPMVVRPLLTTGMVFLVLQVAGLVGYEIDNLVIAQVLGPEYVQQYAIPMKLFMLTPALLSPALMPLWPAYREAIARKDAAWVHQTVRRSLRITFVINVAAATVLVILGPVILEAWVGSAVSTTPALLLCMGLWAIAFSMSAALAMIINAADGIRVQAILAIFMASANAILSVFLVSRIGIVGAVLGSLIAQVVFILIPFSWYVPRLLKRVAGQPGSEPL